MYMKCYPGDFQRFRVRKFNINFIPVLDYAAADWLSTTLYSYIVYIVCFYSCLAIACFLCWQLVTYVLAMPRGLTLHNHIANCAVNVTHPYN